MVNTLDDKSVEPKSGLKLNRKILLDRSVKKLSNLILLFGLVTLLGSTSALNYGVAKSLHESERWSKERIERGFQEFPSKQRTKEERITAYGVQQILNIGYWGRQIYYLQNKE